MSQDNIKVKADVSCCASCGIAEIDDVKLMKDCDDCDLVKYCCNNCQEDHKLEHEEACKKRAADLREELLFKHPEETYLGDCPICILPLPLDQLRSSFMTCCSKIICNGCKVANLKRQLEMRLALSCPFCRKPEPETEEELLKRNMKRVAMNDPDAMCYEGGKKYDKGEYRSAFEYWTKAAKLGSADAHCKLGVLYDEGHGVEKDREKKIFHFEEAAIGGHTNARHGLGYDEYNNGNHERSVKHFIISATQGLDGSMKSLMTQFRRGYVSKEELAATLRAHKAAVDATKSPQREFAVQFEEMKRKQINEAKV